jgi:hypothetical protein
MNPATGAPTAPQMPSATPPQPAGDASQFGDYSNWAQQEMAKGFSPEQLQQHLNSNGITVKGPHSGNWLTHLLPTIGSVAIPALGALLAPETGGLSLVAAAGLSGLGAAGGKAAENAAEGKDVINKDVLDEGLMGAAGGAAGGVVGKGLGKAASMLGGAAEKIGTEKAGATAAKDAIDATANTYKDVNPKLQANLGAKDALEHVGSMGYDHTDPSNLLHVSNTSNDILNDTLNKALADAGPVDVSHYNQLVREALAKEGGTLGSFDKVAMSRGRFSQANTPAAKLLQQLENLGAGVAKTNADPNEIRTLTTKLGQLAQDAKPMATASTGAIDPSQRSIYNVINDVRNQLKTSLYDRPEVHDALTALEGNIAPDEAMNITPQLAEHLNNVITSAGKDGTPAAQSLLSEISRNINIGDLGKEGQKVGQIVTSTGAKARAAGAAGLGGEQAPNGNPVLDTVSAFAGGPHGMLSSAVKGAAHAATNPAIYKHYQDLVPWVLN